MVTKWEKPQTKKHWRYRSSVKVSNIIDANGKWNFTLIKNLIEENDVKEIKKIKT